MAVAIKKYGYTNIKIYNGGIKDWKGAKLPTVSLEPLPEYAPPFITSEELLAKMKARSDDPQASPSLTLLDFRTEQSMEDAADGLPRIQTTCPVITGLLDDLRSPEFRGRIPKDGLVVTVTETGNRDDIAVRYLSSHGYTNVRGLEFGMRAWLKNKYPIE